MHVPTTNSTYHGESAPPSETEEPRAAGPSQSLPKTMPESGAPHTGVASGKESSADFLKAVSADQTGAGEPGSSVETTYGKLLRPPHPSEQDQSSSTISHPVRPSSGADPPQAFDGPPKEELDKLVDKANPYPNGDKPRVEEHDIANSGLKKYDSKNSADSGTPDNVHQEEGNPGNTPTDGARLTTHPDYADYKQRRPEQVLSHFSSVMLYHANNAKTKPTEVQYGYLRDENNNLKLYSSANSLKAQQWLKDNSSGDKLLDHVKAAAKQNDNPDVKRHALKLLYFQENQQARRNEINHDSSLSEAEKGKLLDDLKQTDELHKEFFTGTHHVVTNTASKPQAGAQGGKGKSGKASPPIADNKVQRHAEQNIAEQMHADRTGGLAEIAGTKIRCGSCNSALGPSMKDAKEGYYITGQYYDGQSSKSSMHDTVAAEDERGRPASKTSTKTGARSSSTSPARVESEKYYQHRDDIKPPATSKA